MRRLLIACLSCVAALLLAAPGMAFAVDGTYSVDELSTVVEAGADGSAHIVERQVLTFNDQNAGVTWYLHVPESGESVRVNSVRVAPVDNGGTQLEAWTTLQMIDSKPREQGRYPGDTANSSLRRTTTQPWYSYNIGDGMMRCYFPTGTAAKLSDSNLDLADLNTYVIETDYTIGRRVRLFRDVSELYWRYANDSLPGGAKNVSLLVRLPVPPDTDPATIFEYVNAWGHGPDNGTFDILGDGTVSYHIDQVPQGYYAEAHVIYPADWTYDVPANYPKRFSELRRTEAIAGESAWVDLAQREAAWDNKVRVLFLVIAVLVILVGALSVILRRRMEFAHRALVRVGVTLAIIGLGEHLFFHEPLTTLMLAALAAVVLGISFLLPTTSDEQADEVDEAAEVDEADEADSEPAEANQNSLNEGDEQEAKGAAE